MYKYIEHFIGKQLLQKHFVLNIYESYPFESYFLLVAYI